MIYLVTGGSGSGKSEYAENLVMASGCPVRYYVATMTVYGEEGLAKVLRHQELRRGKGFITVECQADVGTALCGIRNSNQEKAILLLECVSNLAANEMFADGGGGRGNVPFDKLADKLDKDTLCLTSREKDRVFVTNEGAPGGIIYD